MPDSRNSTVKLAAQAEGHRRHAEKQQQQGGSGHKQQQQGDSYGDAFGDVGHVRTIDSKAEAEKKANAASL